MAKIEVVNWNPKKQIRAGVLSKFLPRARVNNFGDLLGPVIVSRVLKSLTLDADSASASRRLLAIGSIVHEAREGDVLWGAGVNGRIMDSYSFTHLDVRMVRGPLSRDFLVERGIEVPQIFGDPGLLLGHYWTQKDLSQGFSHRSFVEIPNLNDVGMRKENVHLVNPQSELWSVIGRIAASDFVCGSSLHAIVVAESLGIPARLIRSDTEPILKYDDYFMGTGRGRAEPAENLEHALKLGGQEPPVWSAKTMIDAFPADLWSATG